MGTGIILLNLGGPHSIEDIEPFLHNLFADREIIPLGGRLSFILQKFIANRIVKKRLPEVIENYSKIGGKTPLLERTREQGSGLEERLNKMYPDHGPFRVVIAMRYWHPMTQGALDQLQEEGITRIVALTLYPHYSAVSTGSSVNELKRCIKQANHPFEMTVIDRYGSEPSYVNSMTAKIQPILKETLERFGKEKTALIFSAHSVPVSFIKKGDPYVKEIEQTRDLILERLEGDPDAYLTYQSQAGPVEWVGTPTEVVIKELAKKGKKAIVIVPIAFVSDHIETIYEIGMLFRDVAMDCGFEEFIRVPGLNDSPDFLDSLTGLVARHLGIGEPVG